MTSTQIPANDFPAFHGRGVTQAHANLCATRGHATHTVDGVDTGVCPRCGEVTIPAPQVHHLTRTIHGWTAQVDGIPVYITDGRAYWMKDRFDGQPLTTNQQRALDCAAITALRNA